MVMSLVPQSEREEILSVNLPSEIPVQQAVISGLEYISKAHEQIPVSIPPSTLEAADNNESESLWKRIHVAPGDNMSLIFDRLQLPPTVLYKVMMASQDTNALKYLLPGQELRFRITEGELQSMEYDRDLLTTLQINRVDDTYVTSILETELISNIRRRDYPII
jgi:cell envelope opacity-associated protein A